MIIDSGIDVESVVRKCCAAGCHTSVGMMRGLVIVSWLHV